VVLEHGGKLPQSIEALNALPGVGKATAGAILAFAFNTPVVFIETNIRRVFIHQFFRGKNKISDREILSLVEKTLDKKNPREWYYALMDYGSMLKKEKENPNIKSAHYRRQAPFESSNRKIRGLVLKILLERISLTESKLRQMIPVTSEKLRYILTQLVKESLVKAKTGKYSIA
jgi:A/G-specific adenine glycosylase